MNLDHIKNLEELKLAKAKFYADGSEIKTLQDSIKTAAPAERGQIGKRITELKTAAEAAFAAKMQELENKAVEEKLKAE